MTPLAPAHVAPGGQPILSGVVLLALLGSGLLLALGLVAYARRRTPSYLLVALALSTLLARSALGVMTVGGMVTYEVHHLFEHALDVVMALLVLAAVYYARRVESAYASGDNP